MLILRRCDRGETDTVKTKVTTQEEDDAVSERVNVDVTRSKQSLGATTTSYRSEIKFLFL